MVRRAPSWACGLSFYAKKLDSDLFRIQHEFLLVCCILSSVDHFWFSKKTLDNTALIGWLIATTSSELCVDQSGFSPRCPFACSLCYWYLWDGLSAGSPSQINVGGQKSHSGKRDIVVLPLMFLEGNLLIGTS